MSTITIKNVPPGVHRALKARAKAHGRSLNREIIATLESSVRSSRVDAQAILSQARAVREAMAVHLTQEELMRFKAEGRR